jgi:xanthine/CO dehydrogenase XdhC/CoxF family maturation factor
VESQLTPLLPLYLRERQAGRSLALAIVLDTAGSTYSKSGALLLIAEDGEYAGLLSGGCLEGDLRERAREVMASGVPCTVNYDMRGPDDLLWGLGAGCEGAMTIFMLRVGPANDWQPLQQLATALLAHQASAVGIVVKPADASARAGDLVALPVPVAESGWLPSAAGEQVFALALSLPPRILLLGAGPDALPVFEFAQRLGWKVTLYDHRAAYAQAARFPGAERVVMARPEELSAKLDLSRFDAAVVMSHHLESDLAFLRALAATGIGYVGLLGPPPRRERLQSELGAEAERLAGRLRSPVGLALGGRSSASIALAIVAEIHAWLCGCSGGPFGINSSGSISTSD